MNLRAAFRRNASTTPENHTPVSASHTNPVLDTSMRFLWDNCGGAAGSSMRYCELCPSLSNRGFSSAQSIGARAPTVHKGPYSAPQDVYDWILWIYGAGPSDGLGKYDLSLQAKDSQRQRADCRSDH